MAKPKIKHSEYIDLLYNKQLPLKEAGKIMGVAVSTITSYRHRHNLPPRGWANNVSPHKGKKLKKESIEKMRKSRIGKNCGPQNKMWKGGQYITSWGYKRILKKGHPSADKAGYVLEHRFVMEEHLGRQLSPKEIVHHINGDKVDNRIENLMIFDRSSHAFHHFPKGSKFGINSHHS